MARKKTVVSDASKVRVVGPPPANTRARVVHSLSPPKSGQGMAAGLRWARAAVERRAAVKVRRGAVRSMASGW